MPACQIFQTPSAAYEGREFRGVGHQSQLAAPCFLGPLSDIISSVEHCARVEIRTGQAGWARRNPGGL